MDLRKLVATGLLTIAGAAGAAVPAATLLDLRLAGENAVSTRLVLPIGGTTSYRVGSFQFETRDPDGSFIGFCVDPFQWANRSFQPYEATRLADLPMDSVRFDQVSRLFGHAYETALLDPVKAAGFQIALWEVFNDDGKLDSGQVRLTRDSRADVRGEASFLLASLPGWTTPGTAYDLRFFGNGQHQDYLAAADLFDSVIPGVPAIPEPKVSVLLALGLLLVASRHFSRKR